MIIFQQANFLESVIVSHNYVLDPHFAQFFNEISSGIGPEISLSMLTHVESMEAKQYLLKNVVETSSGNWRENDIALYNIKILIIYTIIIIIFDTIALVNFTISAKFGRITNSGFQLQFHIIEYLTVSD